MIVGLTGGIASGKSTLSNYIKNNFDLPIIDADLLSREAVLPGSLALQQIREIFGEDYILENGSLNRKKMGECIIEENARSALNGIMHPIIDALYREKLRVLKKEGYSTIIYDCPLLFETEMRNQVETTLLVISSIEDRIQRIIQRDGVDEVAARKKISMQMPDSQKIVLADTIIYNDGSIEDLGRAAAHYFKNITGRNIFTN